ncbi:MAG: peptidase M17 [Pelagibacteraceae bacterium BACL5 MAG-121015-bin10]|jgi:leucyl aminopeptidase|nr:MAG: peptidase M17 [Pelagibacteraceae bacterium BACL5 MAG-121015-bin10]
MIININYNKAISNKLISNYALFSRENYNINFLKNYFSDLEITSIKEIIKNINLKKNIISFNLNSKKKIFLINIKKNINNYEIENLGAEFCEFIKDLSIQNLFIGAQTLEKENKNFISYFLHGLKLRSYEFNIYKSTKEKKILNLTVFSKSNVSKQNEIKFKSIELGTNFARDLVSEPPNVLYPKEYVNRLLKLKRFGVKVTVYNESKLKKLGMNSLLGVGQGSAKESFLVTLEWYGNKKNKKSPLSFVGKGVCFDTGGISLKPAKFMEEMKYDMAGSAVVSGLIQSLAIRKAKVNAIGVVGLVENMPGGNAQRPGDIVKAFNGKTIEVLNTDAEGRLVLADALSFTEKKFKPKFIIDLATLTGAIIVALGEEYAGLFSNNDELSKKLSDSGEKVNEKVWRLPLHKNYDKLMNSNIADIQNINYSGGAGSITAAQFLQRFIEKTPWAHLDIAGMAFSKKAANLNPGGATGFGVRLLNQLIEDHYE